MGPVVGGVLTDVIDYRAAASVSETIVLSGCMYLIASQIFLILDIW